MTESVRKGGSPGPGVLLLRRSYRFSAAHCYRRPDWSEEENWKRFGRCSLEPGHGHDYRLTLEIRGEVDPATGFLVPLEVLDAIVSRRVLDRVDHRHLNVHLERFRPGGEIPSTENLLLWIVEQVADSLPTGVVLQRARLEESEDLGAAWEFVPERTR